MRIKFNKINIEQKDISRFQDNVANVFNTISNNSILDGTIIENIHFKQNIDQKISHNLGRNYKGFIVLMKNNFGEIILSNVDNNQKDRIIILQSNCDMDATIYFV